MSKDRDARREAIRNAWVEGYPASAIARQLGCSRSAVLGSVHRMRDAGILPPSDKGSRPNLSTVRHMGAVSAGKKPASDPKLKSNSGAKRPKAKLIAGVSQFAAPAPKERPAPVFSFGTAFSPLPDVGSTPFGSPGCRWPVGSTLGADTRVCGQPRGEGRPSYCETHHALAYNPVTQRQKAVIRAAERLR